jgi:hypothetical protein
MANFNKPTFTTSTTDITPLVVTQNLSNILSKTGISNQFEKGIKGKFDNYGFVDATFESMMKSVGWVGGYKWCAFYMKVVMMQLFSFDRDWIVKKLGGGAYENLTNVESYNAQGDKRYLAIRKGAPEVADYVALKGKVGGHTFMVTELLGGNETEGWKVRTIEGNTNFTGTSDGEKTESIIRTIKIGGTTKTQVVKGYIRRNFTPSELAMLTYDNAQQTFVFKGQTPASPSNAPKGSISSQILKGKL